MTLRVTTVGVSPLIRAGLEAVIGAADDLERAVSAADVVVTEDHDGIAALIEAGAVVWLAADDEAGRVPAAVAAGATGCVPVTAPLADLLAVIRAAGRCQALIAPPLADVLAAHFAASTPPLSRAFPQLTARELAVLDHLAAGAGIWEAAQALGMATKTVRNHIARIATKLQVVDRTQLVLHARAALAEPAR